MDDISRQAAIDAICSCKDFYIGNFPVMIDKAEAYIKLSNLSPTQPTLYGYNVSHLVTIAKILEKENISPNKVSEALYDISRVIDIVIKEFEDTLRKTVEQSLMKGVKNDTSLDN